MASKTGKNDAGKNGRGDNMAKPYYIVTIKHVDGTIQTQDAFTYREARRVARAMWDMCPGEYVDIADDRGSIAISNQAHGRGMVWKA